MSIRCLHWKTSERPKYARDDPPGHYLCLDCGSTFPLIGDTTKWEPTDRSAEVARELYEKTAMFLYERGWRREELGSGWWWRNGFDEATLGGALEQEFDALDIDQRDRVPEEPDKEYWG